VVRVFSAPMRPYIGARQKRTIMQHSAFLTCASELEQASEKALTDVEQERTPAGVLDMLKQLQLMKCIILCTSHCSLLHPSMQRNLRTASDAALCMPA